MGLRKDMGRQNKNNVTNGDTRVSSPKASFEEAIVATGFGKFNIMLLLFIIPSSFTQAVEQMALSYVAPIAECDLQITLSQKGLLNAMTFAGMIISGPFLGALCDVYGRRKLIVYGYLINAVIQIITASSTTFTQLLISKFFSGFVFTGPFSAATTYLSEFHSSEYRARVQLFRGITYSLGFFTLPLIAWVILPLKFDITLFGYIELHAWNLYLLCCALTPLTASLLFTFLPESPKFLMSLGKNEEALKVFRLIYSVNSGQPRKEFPIKELVEETESTGSTGQKRSVKETISDSWTRIKPIFQRAYIFRLMLACTISMSVLCSMHTIKLWLPQILQVINDYQQEHGGESTNVCAIMDILNKKKTESASTCQVNTDNSFVYLNSMMINGIQMVLFLISGFLVNWLGKPRLMSILLSIASMTALGTYFAPNSAVIITLFTMYLPTLDLSGVMGMTITLEMFPTNIRAIALSLHLMFARVGSMLANVLFPYLVGAGCLAPFLFCCLMTGALPFLICLYPNTEKTALL